MHWRGGGVFYVVYSTSTGCVHCNQWQSHPEGHAKRHRRLGGGEGMSAFTKAFAKESTTGLTKGLTKGHTTLLTKSLAKGLPKRSHERLIRKIIQKRNHVRPSPAVRPYVACQSAAGRASVRMRPAGRPQPSAHPCLTRRGQIVPGAILNATNR